MPEQEKVWGIGLEHEFRTVVDNGNDFTVRRDASHGYFTTRGRIIPGGTTREETERVKRLLSSGEKLLAHSHQDPTVTPGYEVMSLKFQEAKAEKQVDKVIKYEKKIIEKTTIPRNFKRKSVIPFGINDNNFLQMTGDNDYATGSWHVSLTLPHQANTSDIANHKKFAKQLQWLEPLFISKLGGPSLKSVGDAGPESEGSLRTLRNTYGGFGGANVNALEYTAEARQISHAPQEAVHRNLPYFRKTKLKNAMKSDTGMDIQARTSENAEDRRKYGMGVEIRFLDSFDSQTMKDTLKTMIYVAANAKERHETTEDAPIDEDWNNVAARVLEEGWNAYLPASYVQKLRDKLGLEIGTQSVRAADVMGEIEKELWQKNKNSETARLMIQNNTQQPKIHNINRDAWDFYFRWKLRKDPEEKAKFENFMQKLAEIRYDSPEKWIIAGTRGKGIKQLFEHVIGKGYSAEDARDLADFMDKHGLWEIKRYPNGSIEKIRVKYTAEEARNKFNKVVNDISFFAPDTLREYPIRARGEPAIPTTQSPIAPTTPPSDPTTPEERPDSDEMAERGQNFYDELDRIGRHDLALDFNNALVWHEATPTEMDRQIRLFRALARATPTPLRRAPRPTRILTPAQAEAARSAEAEVVRRRELSRAERMQRMGHEFQQLLRDRGYRDLAQLFDRTFIWRDATEEQMRVQIASFRRMMQERERAREAIAPRRERRIPRAPAFPTTRTPTTDVELAFRFPDRYVYRPVRVSESKFYARNGRMQKNRPYRRRKPRRR